MDDIATNEQTFWCQNLNNYQNGNQNKSLGTSKTFDREDDVIVLMGKGNQPQTWKGRIHDSILVERNFSCWVNTNEMT